MTNPIKMEVMEHVAKNEYKCYKYMKDNSTIFLSDIIMNYRSLLYTIKSSSYNIFFWISRLATLRNAE